MCSKETHANHSFPGLFRGSGQIFRVLKEEGRDERQLSLRRKDGGVSQNGVNLPGVLLAESRNRYSGVQRHLVGC